MKKLAGIFPGASLMVTMILASIGCSPVSGNRSGTTPVPSATQVPYVNTVEDFIRNSSTYRFDGIDGSLKMVKVLGPEDGKWDFTVQYRTRHPGHGDRTGQILAQVITTHNAEIKVKDGKVISAVCDGNWDMVSQIRTLPPGQEFTLPVGQSIAVSGENLIIKFVSVTADSRAPKGVQAIWAGEALIQLQVTYQGSTSNVTLREIGLTDGYAQSSFKQYMISFQLQPYPEVDKHVAAGDYKLLMKIDTMPLPTSGPSGFPIVDNRAIVRGTVTGVTKLDSRHPWQVEFRVQSVEHVNNLPNLVVGRIGQVIVVRTDQEVGSIKAGQVISATVSLSSDESETFLFASKIVG